MNSLLPYYVRLQLVGRQTFARFGLIYTFHCWKISWINGSMVVAYGTTSPKHPNPAAAGAKWRVAEIRHLFISKTLISRHVESGGKGGPLLFWSKMAQFPVDPKLVFSPYVYWVYSWFSPPFYRRGPKLARWTKYPYGSRLFVDFSPYLFGCEK